MSVPSAPFNHSWTDVDVRPVQTLGGGQAEKLIKRGQPTTKVTGAAKIRRE